MINRKKKVVRLRREKERDSRKLSTALSAIGNRSIELRGEHNVYKREGSGLRREREEPNIVARRSIAKAFERLARDDAACREERISSPFFLSVSLHESPPFIFPFPLPFFHSSSSSFFLSSISSILQDSKFHDSPPLPLLYRNFNFYFSVNVFLQVSYFLCNKLCSMNPKIFHFCNRFTSKSIF